jgi:hypothetical protein
MQIYSYRYSVFMPLSIVYTDLFVQKFCFPIDKIEFTKPIFFLLWVALAILLVVKCLFVYL